ncbi:hypothetical protein [Schinkia azotoformans]|uniref:hypothetical protein n=1 Tax=Schinkia azotoformans TaxID=1454 RepID=UPI00138AAD6E|nr:hypothetical protein [Schinkia azotoformans]MED4352178.1 hypothetical protein [Schinkia azotoformans]
MWLPIAFYRFIEKAGEYMTLEEYLSTILGDDEIKLATLEPAFTFNLECYEETSHE